MKTLIVMDPSHLAVMTLKAHYARPGHAIEDVKNARAIHKRVRKQLVAWCKSHEIEMVFDERAGRRTASRNYRVALNGSDDAEARTALLNSLDAEIERLIQPQ